MQCPKCAFENVEGAHFCSECGDTLEQGVEAHSWIGQTIGGRYRVSEVLGEGGMGIVYTGEQQMGSTTRKVAIKTLHSHLSQDPSVVARFHRECATVAHLEHPNTIRVYDFGTEKDGTLYIAMEFLSGKSMDRILDSEGSLAPSRVVKIMEQVCGALQEAHEQGIVHRDLKPENIIVGEKLGKTDFVKVLDFGIAARSESADSEKEAKLTQKGMVLGTPPYMSPEQFMGLELDRRSDVYSLGVMTYEMLTGRLPFEASTPWQWATAHMTTQPLSMEQVPSGALVPEAVRRIVMAALAKEPESRPGTCDEFYQLLTAGLGAQAPVRVEKTAEMQAPFMNASLASQEPAAGEPLGDGSMSHVTPATQPIVLPVKKGKLGWVMVALLGLSLLTSVVFFSLPTVDSEAELEGKKSSLESVREPSVVRKQGASSPGNSGKDSAQANVGEGKNVAADTPPDSKLNVEASDAKKSAEQEPSDALAVKGVPAKAAANAFKSTTSKLASAQVAPANSQAKSNKEAPVAAPPSLAPAPADCSKCLVTVKQGNWSSAVSIYRSCNAENKRICSLNAKRQALSQMNKAKGNCKRMKEIAAAAAQMSASSGRVRRAISNCK